MGILPLYLVERDRNLPNGHHMQHTYRTFTVSLVGSQYRIDGDGRVCWAVTVGQAHRIIDLLHGLKS